MGRVLLGRRALLLLVTAIGLLLWRWSLWCVRRIRRLTLGLRRRRSVVSIRSRGLLGQIESENISATLSFPKSSHQIKKHQPAVHKAEVAALQAAKAAVVHQGLRVCLATAVPAQVPDGIVADNKAAGEQAAVDIHIAVVVGAAEAAAAVVVANSGRGRVREQEDSVYRTN